MLLRYVSILPIIFNTFNQYKYLENFVFLNFGKTVLLEYLKGQRIVLISIDTLENKKTRWIKKKKFGLLH